MDLLVGHIDRIFLVEATLLDVVEVAAAILEFDLRVSHQVGVAECDYFEYNQIVVALVALFDGEARSYNRVWVVLFGFFFGQFGEELAEEASHLVDGDGVANEYSAVVRGGDIVEAHVGILPILASDNKMYNRRR